MQQRAAGAAVCVCGDLVEGVAGYVGRLAEVGVPDHELPAPTRLRPPPGSGPHPAQAPNRVRRIMATHAQLPVRVLVPEIRHRDDASTD